MRSIQVSLKFSVDRILCHPKWIDYTEMCTYLVQPCLRLIHTTLWICCDLRHKVALWIIRKISYYLQCNLALCDSRCDLQLVWMRPYLIKPCIWPTNIWSIRCFRSTENLLNLDPANDFFQKTYSKDRLKTCQVVRQSSTSDLGDQPGLGLPKRPA